MNREKLVIVGAGIAAVACLEEIFRLSSDRFDVTVIGAERHLNYNRVLLAEVLRGEKSVEDLYLHGPDWYAARGVRLLTGKKAVSIKRKSRAVVCEDGLEVPYSRLILATGSVPVMPELPGAGLDGIVPFRSAADCERIRGWLESGAKRAVVVGGGLLGLEAAYSLRALGAEVTIVHLADRLMERQLDAQAAGFLKEDFERLGVNVLVNESVAAFEGEGALERVRLAGGGVLEAGLAVVSIGVRPNAALAASSGIYAERGIVVSDTMQTYDPAVWAVGECVQHRGSTFGLVSSVFDQARVLADHVAGLSRLVFKGRPSSARLKVPGVDLFSAGSADEAGAETIEYLDRGGRRYKRLFLRDNRVAGVILYGETSDSARLFDELLSGADVSAKRGGLLLGAGIDRGGPAGAVAPDTAVVCGCVGVTKGTIVEAIRKKGLFTREDVKRETRACTSCGGCAPTVDAILEETLGLNFQSGLAPRGICPCTIYSREDIIKNIREKGLKSVGEVMATLGWATVGCEECRPAINYYVNMVWPGDAVDDPSSRLINERTHANVQKDSSFSVVPRVYGGVVTPDELKRIADAALRHNVPLVKITGGQRIGLFGVKREELKEVWREIGMPSGHAYGKALRTVKSCVGSLHCRYGTQDSLSLAVRLERRLEGLWTPAKVKMGVSGCPRNCAEVSVKDVAVLGTAAGWKVYVGGCGGVETRGAAELASVKTDDEAVETVTAFVQLYREEAAYGERTFKWAARAGLDRIRRAVVEDGLSRGALIKRLEEALATVRDPWKMGGASQAISVETPHYPHGAV